MNNYLELLPNGFIASYVFIVGLCIGSFLNVAILRGLSGEEMFFARSKCPKCNNQLKWYMNIPLFSYLFLKGKCAFCKTKISFQYPIVEFITGCAFLASYFAFGLSLKTFFVCIFLALYIVMSATDFIETVILDYHAYILLAVALLYSYFGLGDINIIQSLIGAGFGFLLFEIFARIGHLFAGCRMFGEGDSLIALGLGATFGWRGMLIIFAMSIFLQSICSIPVMVIKAIKQGKNKLAISYLAVFFSLILMCLNNYFSFKISNLLYYSIVLPVVAVLLWALKNIVYEIKQKSVDESQTEEEKFCLLPFGPALLVSATVCVFYFSLIKDLIKGFIA